MPVKKQKQNVLALIARLRAGTSDSDSERIARLWNGGEDDVSRITFERLVPVTRDDLIDPEMISDDTLSVLNAARKGRVVLRIDGRIGGEVDAKWIETLTRLAKRTTNAKKKAV